MVQNMKSLYNKIKNKLTPNFVKRKQNVNTLKEKFEKEYSSKLESYDNPLVFRCNDMYTNEKFIDDIYPIFTFEYNKYHFVDSPFKTFKDNLILNKFTYPHLFEYKEFTDDFIKKMLLYTSCEYCDYRLESLLKIFMSEDIENKNFLFCNIFVDYGKINYDGKEYSFISYKNNHFLTDIFFKTIAEHIINTHDISPDGIKCRTIPQHDIITVLLDFDGEKLKYYYTDYEPKLKVLVKLYKDRILDDLIIK